MTVYRVKDWGRFQHYRDRRPPWIKLYVEVIDQYDETGAAKKFHSLPDSAKLTFFAVICLASRYGGTIPNADPAWLRAQLGIETVSLEPLIAAGYIVADNGASNDASTGASNLAHNPLDPDIDREKSQIPPPTPPVAPGGGIVEAAKPPPETTAPPDPTPKRQRPDGPAAVHDKEVPEFLRTASFANDTIAALFNDWLAERRQRRRYATARACREALAKLAGYPPAVQEQALRDSIANGWQGIFPDRTRPGGGAGPPKPVQYLAPTEAHKKALAEHLAKPQRF